MMASVCSWPAPLACLVIRKPLRFWPKARSEAKTRQGPSFAQQKFFAPCPLRLVLSECGGAKGGEAAPRPNRMRGSNCKRLWPKGQICERMFSRPHRNRIPRQSCHPPYSTAPLRTSSPTSKSDCCPLTVLYLSCATDSTPEAIAATCNR